MKPQNRIIIDILMIWFDDFVHEYNAQTLVQFLTDPNISKNMAYSLTRLHEPLDRSMTEKTLYNALKYLVWEEALKKRREGKNTLYSPAIQIVEKHEEPDPKLPLERKKTIFELKTPYFELLEEAHREYTRRKYGAGFAPVPTTSSTYTFEVPSRFIKTPEEILATEKVEGKTDIERLDKARQIAGDRIARFYLHLLGRWDEIIRKRALCPFCGGYDLTAHGTRWLKEPAYFYCGNCKRSFLPQELIVRVRQDIRIDSVFDDINTSNYELRFPKYTELPTYEKHFKELKRKIKEEKRAEEDYAFIRDRELARLLRVKMRIGIEYVNESSKGS